MRSLEQLDRAYGPCMVLEPGSVLGRWYDSVKFMPLMELGESDLCRVAQLQIHVRHVLPLLLSALERDPFCGESYDGHVLATLAGISPLTWRKVPLPRKHAEVIAQGLQHTFTSCGEPEIQRNYAKLVKHLALSREYLAPRA